MVERACKKCNRIYEGDKCPNCGSQERADKWKGKVVIFDVESEIAKNIGVTKPGTYAIKI